MSMEYTVFIGNYVKVPIQYEDVSYEEFYCEKCNEKLYTEFCSKCGSPKKIRTIVEKEGINLNNLLNEEEGLGEEFTDILSNVESEFYCFINNWGVNDEDGKFDISLSPGYGDSEGVFNLPEKVGKKFFKNLTDILDKHKIPYTYEYGIVAYYNYR